MNKVDSEQQSLYTLYVINKHGICNLHNGHK